MTQEFLAGTIDHTLLKPHADSNQIAQLFEEAIHFGFHSVCVNPSRVEEANSFLKDYQVQVCSVVGFPLGASTTRSKLYEVEYCLQKGVSEIDMVMNIGFFKNEKYNIVSDEIIKMVQNAHGKIIKVIIESGILSKEEIIAASKLVEDSGAHFVKTSTGFSAFGASPEIIKMIKTTLKSDTKIKASGGIKSLNQVEELIDAGADRIGSSSGIIIMEEITDK